MRLAEGYYSCEGVVLGPEDACEEFPNGAYRVTWKTPRAKGLEVRLYGVTECLASDIYGAFIDGGWCLRQARANDISGTLGVNGQQYLEHAPIPDSWLVPLARAKASKGRAVFELEPDLLGAFPDPADQTADLYAIVAAVYDADGQRSPFTVVYSSHYCEVIEDLDCPESYDSQMGYYPVT